MLLICGMVAQGVLLVLIRKISLGEKLYVERCIIFQNPFPFVEVSEMHQP
jgi:hypothetical protein